MVNIKSNLEVTCGTVTCGIPQGSCLGPLLLIIYLNDFEKCWKVSKAGMYADDTHVTLTSMNVEELVHKAQEELTHISEYMTLNESSVNPKKNRAYDNWTPSQN